MSKNQQLMSQKEKDYIASCFNRAASSAKTELNYEDILNENKIEYDLKEDKRSIDWFLGIWVLSSQTLLFSFQRTF